MNESLANAWTGQLRMTERHPTLNTNPEDTDMQSTHEPKTNVARRSSAKAITGQETARSSAKSVTAADLAGLLDKQRQAYLQDPMPSRKTRIHRLDRLHNALFDYRAQLEEAVSADFSNRAVAETNMTELDPLLQGIAYYRKRLGKFMKPQRRHTPLSQRPASAMVHYQPLGVVGIVAPWNFPIFLALSPLVGALAAGNRAMIKTSEFSPRTGELLKEMIADAFSDDEVLVVTGDVDVATAFTKLPFDHLVFTGSTSVGKIVMRAAAENLTPVTLELGGKSPAIIHRDFPIEEAAKRLAFSKGINAGQLCVSPDYVLCPRDQVDAFCNAFADSICGSYPTMRDNKDYTAIITDRQKERLEGYLVDAQEKGAELLVINPAKEDFSGTRKMPMTLVKGANDDMKVLQDEIFGPIITVVPYDSLEDAIDYVNSHPRPLALYYFDWDKRRAQHVVEQTHSGGVALNEATVHVLFDDLPFGGVGPSGMGHYHGKEGFLTFSKAKGVIRKGRINPMMWIAPPWENWLFRQVAALQSRRYRRRAI